MKKNKKTNFQSTKDFQRGLTSEEAYIRKKEGYSNVTKDKTEKSICRILFDNFFNFFNIVLLAIAASFAFFVIYLNVHGYKEIADEFFGVSKFTFLIPMILNSIIGSYQEIHSKRVLHKLRIVNSFSCNAIRDGKEISLKTEEVVLGDILHLKAGEQACCDILVLDGELEVDESLLTGESDFIKKKKGDIIYSGSSIIVGSCYGTADKVGEDTYAAKLSKQVKTLLRHKSELMTNLYSIIKMMAVILIFVCAIVVGTLAYKVNRWGNDPLIWPDQMVYSLTSMVTWSKIVLTMGAYAIGIIPTGLVLMTSVTLAVSITSLAKKNTMIQELFSLENLSRVDTICLDKTGTLTDGSMKLDRLISYISEEEVISYLQQFNYASTDSNQTSLAIKEAYKAKESNYVKFLPFSSQNKTSTLILDQEISLTLGAPDYLIKEDEDAFADYQKYAKEGKRVLAFLKNDKLIALILLEDNVRPSAKDTIDYFYDNNVDCKIISGDNLLTVSKIAKECHVRNTEKGISLEGVSSDQIAELVKEYTIFARVTPEQKQEIVQQLQKCGKKVAMTGDGVNDILALRKANASITFAKATQAAKSVCDVVLLDNDFSHLKEVVSQGRRVVNNVQRTACLFLMKTVAIALLSILLIPFKRGQMWFGVENLYLMQTTIIAIGGFFLSLESSKRPIEGNFKKNVFPRAILSGIVLAASILIPILLNQIPNAFGKPGIISEENVSTMISLLSFFSGFVVMIAMCMPVNKYRGIIICLSFFAACLLAMISPTTYIGGHVSSFSMFSSPDGNFLHSQFMKEFFRPWNAPCIQAACRDVSNLITIVLFCVTSFPVYILLMKFVDKKNKSSVNKCYKTKNLG